ncbi:MAG: hypothetical protein JWP52_4346, partial [Rhizobacter sp.]|nr:hypothetical protein [Rhizobacter sp.]
MYTQALDVQPLEAKAGASALQADDAAQAARFEARIDAGDFIEAKDWMPE